MHTRHALTLMWRDGREETVRPVEDQTILEAAESSGVSFPFGCRTGACATCVGRLIEETVSYERPPRALKARHVEEGFALCCIVHPRTECRIEVGAHLHIELFPNPWK